MIFVDTNYFIRFLLGDVADQHEKVKKLFEDGAKGNKKLFTSTIVVFEIYWLFSSFYEKTKDEVGEILQKVLALNFIMLSERDIFEEALKLFQNSNLDLEDCYNIVFSKSKKMVGFASFDKKLLRVLEKNN